MIILITTTTTIMMMMMMMMIILMLLLMMIRMMLLTRLYLKDLLCLHVYVLLCMLVRKRIIFARSGEFCFACLKFIVILFVFILFFMFSTILDHPLFSVLRSFSLTHQLLVPLHRYRLGEPNQSHMRSS